MGITGCPHAAVDVTSNVTYVDCRESDLLTRRSAQHTERERSANFANWNICQADEWVDSMVHVADW